jgi:transcriptional regulator with XRE-family HTH domain
MGRQHIHLLPKHRRLLAGLGENLRLARLRRNLSAEQVAERAGLSRSTLHAIEKGEGSCSLASYFQVLAVLGLERDIEAVGRDDALGRKLQDAGLAKSRQRAPKSKPKPPNP